MYEGLELGAAGAAVGSSPFEIGKPPELGTLPGGGEGVAVALAACASRIASGWAFRWCGVSDGNGSGNAASNIRVPAKRSAAVAGSPHVREFNNRTNRGSRPGGSWNPVACAGEGAKQFATIVSSEKMASATRRRALEVFSARLAGTESLRRSP
jgi:hypothetical protein